MKLKKLISFGVAAVMLSSALVFTNAATTIMTGDVNVDGKVSIADLTTLAKYLNGTVNISLDRGDINDDGVVDSDDVTMLTRFISSEISLPPTKNILDMTATSSGERDYYKHIMDKQNTVYINNNQNQSPYTLIVGDALGGNINTTDNKATPFTRIEREDTRSAGTFNPIVKVSGNGGYGTGFIIDSNLIATAAHCVYNEETNQWINNLTVIATINGIKTEFEVLETHVLKSYVDSGKTIATDYALIRIKTIDKKGISHDLLSECGKLVMSPLVDTKLNEMTDFYKNNSPIKHIMAAGYSDGYLHSAWGHAFTATQLLPSNHKDPEVQNKVLCYTAFVTGGDSGAPIFFDKDANASTDDRVVVAIHSSSSGYTNDVRSVGLGPRVNSQLMKFYYDNKNIGY